MQNGLREQDLGKALQGLKDWEKPRVINTDKAPTYPAALAELKAEGKCPKNTLHRQVKYPQQRHRGRLRQAEAADPPRARLQDAEDRLRDDQGLRVMRALRKGQAAIFNIARDIRGEASLVERAFGLGVCALAKTVQFVRERLDLQAA
jgi:transposase-like protein